MTENQANIARRIVAAVRARVALADRVVALGDEP